MRSSTVAAALLAAPMLASANLVINGSFEADTQAAGTWSIHPSLTGWSSGQFGVELRHDVAGSAYDGVNFVELDTTHNSFVTQVIDTSLGQTYKLSFAYSGREGVPVSSNGIEVFWNGLSRGVFAAPGASSGHLWHVVTLNVIAAASSSSLMFQAVGTDDGYGGSLDAVRLTPAIPEPASIALFLAGLAAVCGVAYRRKA